MIIASRPGSIMARHLILVAFLISSIVPAAAESLEDLMAGLAKVEERQARFVEERTFGVLDEKLVTEGTLSYQAPDQLIRQDLWPESAIYEIEGNVLKIVTNGEEKQVALDQEPLLAAMITPFRAIFAGDLAALNTDFEPRYAEQGDGWTITLQPKSSSPSRHFIHRVEITGEDLMIARIDVIEQGGDLSSMRLSTPPSR